MISSSADQDAVEEDVTRHDLADRDDDQAAPRARWTSGSGVNNAGSQAPAMSRTRPKPRPPTATNCTIVLWPTGPGGVPGAQRVPWSSPGRRWPGRPERRSRRSRS
jgi:hypothetical protein